MTIAQQRSLYGGAISLAIPDAFIDVSTLREIPDHQEVFTDVKTDMSVIIELNTMAEDSESISFGSSAESFLISRDDNVDVQSELPFLKEVDCKVKLVEGEQRISKFRETASNVVRIYLAVIRIPSIETDILISMNNPIVLAEESSSSRTVDKEEFSAKNQSEDSLKVFKQILKSFKINDWNLFK
ncbi:Mog1p/PsbP-like protein [Rozella allomycis CSF55]|uniref:Mog1p/PsbP-like protein n=1 Tax=Rozella allomycis (strain CSF55) TaxID=988480 RepID=A0A075AXY4_ROZAC|nr:Ran-interacting Mog1 protein domain-containing protein [Rozella allomycis CSF55]RKP16843.1 Mog1p/PsbP-like protein [Rozella allomycis CSF55]|eukprot:EPZ35087.1 Ran-interacting Mog1 protein domain-containing protein [Rozella allomycis CSF55]